MFNAFWEPFANFDTFLVLASMQYVSAKFDNGPKLFPPPPHAYITINILNEKRKPKNISDVREYIGGFFFRDIFLFICNSHCIHKYLRSLG
jgi:hypothetical protein